MEPCAHLPLPAPPFQLVLPGGAELLGVDLGAVAPPALAPLVPLFRIADLVVKVADLVAALPDAVAVPPNPGPLVARVPAVARAAAEVGLVLPPVSVPALAVSLLDALVRFVEVELIRLKRVPTPEQMDRLADSLASIEYYLEASRDQRGGRDRELAGQSLDEPLGDLAEEDTRLREGVEVGQRRVRPDVRAIVIGSPRLGDEIKHPVRELRRGEHLVVRQVRDAGEDVGVAVP